MKKSSKNVLIAAIMSMPESEVGKGSKTFPGIVVMNDGNKISVPLYGYASAEHGCKSIKDVMSYNNKKRKK